MQTKLKFFIVERLKFWKLWIIYFCLFLFGLIYSSIETINNSSNLNISNLGEALMNYRQFFGSIALFGLLSISCFIETRELFLYNFGTLYYENLKDSKSRIRISVVQILCSFLFIFIQTILIQFIQYLILIIAGLNPLSYFIAALGLEVILIISIFILLPVFWLLHYVLKRKFIWTNFILFLSIILLFVNQIITWSWNNIEKNKYDSLDVKINEKTDINILDIKNIISVQDSNIYKAYYYNFNDDETTIKTTENYLSVFNENNKVNISIATDYDAYLFKKISDSEIFLLLNNKIIYEMIENFIYANNQSKTQSLFLNNIWENNKLDTIINFFGNNSQINIEDSYSIMNRIYVNNNGIHISRENNNDKQLLNSLLKECFLYILYSVGFDNNAEDLEIFDNFFGVGNYKMQNLQNLDSILWNKPDRQNKFSVDLQKENYNQRNLSIFVDFFVTSVLLTHTIRTQTLNSNFVNDILKFQNQNRLENILDVTSYFLNLETLYKKKNYYDNFIYHNNKDLWQVSHELNRFTEINFVNSNGKFYINKNINYASEYLAFIIITSIVLIVILNTVFIIERNLQIKKSALNYDTKNLMQDIVDNLYKKKGWFKWKSY